MYVCYAGEKLKKINFYKTYIAVNLIPKSESISGLLKAFITKNIFPIVCLLDLPWLYYYRFQSSYTLSAIKYM